MKKFKKVGIIGSGQVAQILGNGFLQHGYNVMLGSGHVQKLQEWLRSAGEKAAVGSFNEAANFGEILVLAVAGSVAQEVLEQIDSNNINGKTLIDVTNPIATDKPPVNGVIQFFTNAETSLMEILQNKFSDTKFVKAFNSVGSGLMVNPKFKEGRPTMFICGKDNKAKKEVADILDEFGWEAEDMGTATSAGTIEQLCILWCIPGMLNNNWTHAFKLLKR